MNEFEQKLSRQPLRQVPADWRAEILAAADVNRREVVRAFTSAATIRLRLREIFWPAPTAWAGLAAVWIFIFAVNFSMRDTFPRIAEKSAPPSPEVMGPRETPDADRQKIFSPKPRSERVEILMT